MTSRASAAAPAGRASETACNGRPPTIALRMTTDSHSGAPPAAPAAARSSGRSTAASTAASFLVALAPAAAARVQRSRGRACSPRRLSRRTSTGRARGRSRASCRRRYPDRAPGSAGALGAAGWVRDQFRGVRAARVVRHVDRADSRAATWRGSRTSGRSRRGSRGTRSSSWRTATTPAIGPGANDNASGTAALVELARGYAATGARRAGRARPPRAHARLPLDRRRARSAGSARRGSPGACRSTSSRVDQPDRDRRRRGAATLVITGDAPRSAAALLVATAAERIAEQGGQAAQRPSVLGAADRPRLPVHALRAGPVRRARHSRGDADDRRRATARGVHRSPGEPRPRARSTALGRAAQELVGSLDQGLELARGTTSFVWVGGPGRARLGDRAAAVRAARPVPGRRRRPVRALPPARHPARPGVSAACASRLAFWLFVGLAFYAFGSLGAWPRGPAAAAEPVDRGGRRLGGAARCSLLGARARPRLARRASAARAAPAGLPRRAARRRASPALLGCAGRRVARSGNKPVRAALLPARPARLALAAAGPHTERACVAASSSWSA